MSVFLRRFGSLFGVVMFLLALVALRKELHGHTIGEIIIAARSVPLQNIVIAAALTFICYGVLTGYDLLAINAVPARIGTASVMLNSFICHALSINVGFSPLTGGSFRCFYYLRKGVGPPEVLQIVTFCLLTFWLGFLTLGGAIFLLLPPALPSFVHVSAGLLKPLGLLFLIVVLAFFLWNTVRRKPIVIWKWAFPVIPANLAITQIVIAVSEWMIGTAVLYALLPASPSLTYFHLLGFYFLAQISGLVSQVPSGLGVFESIILALLPSDIDPSAALASLLLYRFVFNLLPLSAASLLLLLRELRHRRTSLHLT